MFVTAYDYGSILWIPFEFDALDLIQSTIGIGMHLTELKVPHIKSVNVWKDCFVYKVFE